MNSALWLPYQRGWMAPLEVSLGHWLCSGDRVCPERHSLLPHTESDLSEPAEALRGQ